MWTVLLRARCVSGVLRVLRARARCVARFSWEDVDVFDASFMQESRIQVLRTLLESDTTSLYALNAPSKGVTPLGLAAWLNLPDAIRVLLAESRGLVAVDGTDCLGVTPLMCKFYLDSNTALSLHRDF